MNPTPWPTPARFSARPTFLRHLVLAALLGSLIPLPAQEDDLGTLVNKGIAALNEQRWEDAFQLHEEAVRRFGGNQPLTLFGPQFGNIHYRKGITELKLGKWAEAAQSFEICYRDFPNEATTPVTRRNQFHKMALLKWGEAAMGAKEWELAVTQFQKFLEERNPEQDKVPMGTFYVNLAICQFHAGNIPAGNEALETAIRNKTVFPTADSAIVAGFQALVVSGVTRNNEQAILDFIEKNRGEILIDPFEMSRYSAVFLRLAGDAIAAGMERAPIALYHLVTPTDIAIDDTRAVLQRLGPAPGLRDAGRILRKDSLEPHLASLEEQRRGNRPPESLKLAAAAFLHERHGNVRGANAAYRLLDRLHPQTEKREDNLYNLVRTSSLLGDVPATEESARRFLQSFPNSSHAPAVRKMLLSQLFFDRKYDACIEIATPMLRTLAENTDEHDLCLHVLAGSHYYSGNYDKAEPLLDQHVESYPESLFAVASRYFQAANAMRLGQWSVAAKRLDAFLEKHPDSTQNPYLPFALFDRANCHFAEEQFPPALDILSRILKDFPDSRVVEQSHALRGNILETEEQWDDARKSYLRALELSKINDNPSVAGEALFSLVRTIVSSKTEDPERLAEAAQAADEFWRSFAVDSPFVVQMAVTQAAPLKATGRYEDAMSRLRAVIAEVAKQPDATGLESAIDTYTASFLERSSPEELREHYYNFPGIRSADRAARALLRIAIIGVFEEVAKSATEDAARTRAQTMIRVLFQELKSDFAPADLSSYILVKLGDYLRTNTSTPAEALTYYDAALNRDDPEYRFAALLGRADVNGRSTDAAQLDAALADFEKVYAESEEKAQREFALYRIIELLMARSRFDLAADRAKIYLDRDTSGFSKYAPEVGLLLAQSYEQRRMTEDAIAMYIKVWVQMGYIKVSAPAILAWMKLTWDRNLPGDPEKNIPADRQGAYDAARRYLELTGRFQDKMTESDLALWKEVETLLKIYEADPNIRREAPAPR